MTTEAVTNSTCLIGLERIGQLDLLSRVFSTVYAPPMVATEIKTPLSWLRVKPVQNVGVVATLKTQMDAGEAEAISLAMELGDVLLILDDKKARRVAQQLNLKVIGTVGMLLRGKRQGVISEIKPLIMALLEADFRISEGIVREALQLSGEI